MVAQISNFWNSKSDSADILLNNDYAPRN